MVNMRRLAAFENVSLDGYFVDRHGSMMWAKDDNDEEFRAFTAENAKGGGTLIFGRVTYEMMASFWPTPQAYAMLPVVAERMNNGCKVVFSRTMANASWSNTKLNTGDLVKEIRRMKSEEGEGMVILGSGSIVAQLTQEGLIDEYQVVIHPIVLGAGRTIFEGVQERVPLKLTRSRIFRNGKVFLCYERGTAK